MAWSREINKPITRLSPEGYSPSSIFTTWGNQLSKPGTHIILDLDENLFDTVQHWIHMTNAFLKRYAGIPSDMLPTIDAVCEEGGPSTYYPTHFDHVFPSSEAYEVLADEMRHRRAGNRFGEPMYPDMPRIIAIIKTYGSLLGAITARPATNVVIEATKAQLQHAYVPDIPVIYKPLAVSLAQASTLKLSYLSMLEENPARQGRILLIDDSISTARLIQRYNQDHSNNAIIQVINGSGRLTKPVLDRGEFTSDHKHGIFIMPTWNDLEQTLQDVHGQINEQTWSS